MGEVLGMGLINPIPIQIFRQIMGDESLTERDALNLTADEKLLVRTNVHFIKILKEIKLIINQVDNNDIIIKYKKVDEFLELSYGTALGGYMNSTLRYFDVIWLPEPIVKYKAFRYEYNYGERITYSESDYKLIRVREKLNKLIQTRDFDFGYELINIIDDIPLVFNQIELIF